MATGRVLINNRYEIVCKIGEGIEAEVYLVKDQKENNLE
jgi:hypothetical protein